MTEIVGHEKIRQQFERAIANGRLASSFLFVGPAGVGKFAFARSLARDLLCQQPVDGLKACGTCPSCAQVDASSHPDLIVVKKRADKNRLLMEQFVGEADKRGQSGLCHDISLRSFSGGRKIAIIDDADFLNQESANALLKTLEEPPKDSILILVGTSEQRQLPTIRSRCQIIRFGRLSNQQVESILAANELIPEGQNATVAACSNGSLQMAIQIGSAETTDFRKQLLEQLASPEPFENQFSKTISDFVDAAGKDAAVRRDRLRLVTEFAISFYQAVLAIRLGQPLDSDDDLRTAVQTAVESERLMELEIADCLEACLEVQNQIMANANQATMIENWLINLGRCARGERVFVSN